MEQVEDEATPLLKADLDVKREAIARLNQCYLSERKAASEWALENYQQLLTFHKDPWLMQLLDEVLHCAQWASSDDKQVLDSTAIQGLRKEAAELLKGPDSLAKR